MEPPRPLTEQETKIIKLFKQAGENHAALKGIKNQWSIYYISREAGLDLSSYPKESLIIQAIWIAFLSIMKNYSSDCEFKYASLQEFKLVYSSVFENIESYSSQELNTLYQIANWMSILFTFIPAKKNKGFALTIVCKLIEGWYIKYVTGSGQTKATRDRVKIFEIEGNVKPAPRMSKLSKERMLLAASAGSSVTLVPGSLIEDGNDSEERTRQVDDDLHSVTSSLTSSDTASLYSASFTANTSLPSQSMNTGLTVTTSIIPPPSIAFSSPRSGDQGIGHSAKRSRKTFALSDIASTIEYGPEHALFAADAVESSAVPICSSNATTPSMMIPSCFQPLRSISLIGGEDELVLNSNLMIECSGDDETDLESMASLGLGFEDDARVTMDQSHPQETVTMTSEDDPEFQSVLNLLRESSGMTWRQCSLTIESGTLSSGCCSVGFLAGVPSKAPSSDVMNAFTSSATAAAAAKIMFPVVPLDQELTLDTGSIIGLPLQISAEPVSAVMSVTTEYTIRQSAAPGIWHALGFGLGTSISDPFDLFDMY